MIINLTFPLFKALLNAVLSTYFFIQGWIFVAICYAIISFIDFIEYLILIDKFDDDDDSDLNTSV